MKKNFKRFVMIIIMALVCVCATGCGMDDVTKTANSAKEKVVETTNSAKEGVSWWTRSTDHQSWTNPTGTRIEITERRKEGDFRITVTYPVEVLNQDNREGVRPTGDATITIYADSISEELMEELQSY